MIIARQRKAGARKEALAATKEREATDRPWRMRIRTEKPKQRRYTTNGAKSQKAKAGSINSRQRSNGASSKASSIDCSKHRSEH